MHGNSFWVCSHFDAHAWHSAHVCGAVTAPNHVGQQESSSMEQVLLLLLLLLLLLIPAVQPVPAAAYAVMMEGWNLRCCVQQQTAPGTCVRHACARARRRAYACEVANPGRATCEPQLKAAARSFCVAASATGTSHTGPRPRPLSRR